MEVGKGGGKGGGCIFFFGWGSTPLFQRGDDSLTSEIAVREVFSVVEVVVHGCEERGWVELLREWLIERRIRVKGERGFESWFVLFLFLLLCLFCIVFHCSTLV